MIAIFAILAAILFPVFAEAREKACLAACLSNHKQVGTAMLMYAQDYDETFVGMYHTDPVTRKQPLWPKLLQPYLKNTNVYREPSNMGRTFYELQDHPDNNQWLGRASVAQYDWFSYVVAMGRNACAPYLGFPMAIVQQPADVIAFADSKIYYGPGNASNPINDYGYYIVWWKQYPGAADPDPLCPARRRRAAATTWRRRGGTTKARRACFLTGTPSG